MTDLRFDVIISVTRNCERLATFRDTLFPPGQTVGSFLDIGRIVSRYEELGGQLRAELDNEGQDHAGDVADEQLVSDVAGDELAEKITERLNESFLRIPADVADRLKKYKGWRSRVAITGETLSDEVETMILADGAIEFRLVSPNRNVIMSRVFHP